MVRMRNASETDYHVLLPHDFPTVYTLCGSSRFKESHEKAQRDLTLKGHIVIPMGLYGHLEGLDMGGEVKKMLDRLHFRKIDLSDGIFVVNEKVLVCYKCGKACDTTFHPVGASGYSNSKCCLAEASIKPYIGESTRNEIEYAKSRGKEILYLNPVEG